METEEHSGPPAFAHCPLRSLRGLGLRQVGRGPGVAPLRRRPCCIRWQAPFRWITVAWVVLTVDPAPHRPPDLHPELLAPRTPVISLQAPHHRLHWLAPADHNTDRSSLVAGILPSCSFPGRVPGGSSRTVRGSVQDAAAEGIGRAGVVIFHQLIPARRK